VKPSSNASRFVRGGTPGLLLVLLAACATKAPQGGSEFELPLGEMAVTQLQTGRFDLTSPYDAAATAEFARVVGEELERVEALLGPAGGAPFRVHLVPLDAAHTDSRDPDMAALFPARGGRPGAASESGDLFIYVAAPGGGPSAFVQAEMRRDTIRHELTHVVAHRAGLSRAAWFDEGLAMEIESMTVDGGRLRERPFPAALFIARNAAWSGTIAELLVSYGIG